MHRRFLALCVLALAAGTPSLALAQALAGAPAAVNPAAVQALKDMGAYLQTLKYGIEVPLADLLVNISVNIDLDNRGGCCHSGWDDDYHPVATAAAVTAPVAVSSAVIGSIVPSVPPNCVPVNYGGMIYQQCGSAWYKPQGTQYSVVNSPY